jgi:hypothetical protein
MASFVIKSRVTGEIVEETVSAEGREQAIAQKVQSVAPGEQIEVLTVEQIPAAAAGASGASGASGPTGTTGATGASGPTGA